MPSTFYALSSNYYVIECFDYFLVCSVINDFNLEVSYKNTNDLKQLPRQFMAQGLLPVKLTHTQSHTHTHIHTCVHVHKCKHAHRNKHTP